MVFNHLYIVFFISLLSHFLQPIKTVQLDFILAKLFKH